MPRSGAKARWRRRPAARVGTALQCPCPPSSWPTRPAQVRPPTTRRLTCALAACVRVLRLKTGQISFSVSNNLAGARRRRLHRWLPDGMARLRLPGVRAAVGLCDGGSECAEGWSGAGHTGGGAGGGDRIALISGQSLGDRSDGRVPVPVLKSLGSFACCLLLVPWPSCLECGEPQRRRREQI